jgi:serine/threonine protein kinase
MPVVMDGAAGFEPGSRYRNYVIEDLLGRGGMSAVYRARHELTGRLAAIKVMVTRGSRAQADPQALERFRREAEFLCRLEHPNLPAIYDMDVLPDGTGIIVMEHLEGRDLGDLLRERRRLTPVEVFGIAIEIVKPLAFAHNHGIVHRDLKPGNVFICSGSPPPSKGRVRVLDFGIAKHKYSKGITREHMIVGTVSYMSPEQLMGQTDRIDGCSDQYSLGAMLYQALAGHALFIKPGDEVPNPTLLC